MRLNRTPSAGVVRISDARPKEVVRAQSPHTEIVQAGPWWPAEGYHQDYLEKNPGGYTCHYVRDIEFE